MKEEATMENQKAEFDSTICFTFFSDWLEAIEDVETETDKESEAYMLFKAIANYSLFDKEPDFEGCRANRSFKRFWPILSRQIDSSIKNRKRGFTDTNGPTEKGKKVIEAYTKNPQASVRDVHEMTGVSKSEVHRVKRKYLSAGATPIPGASPVPGAVPVPGATPVPGAVPVPGATPVPGAVPVPDVVPIPNANAIPNTNTGTGHGTGRDTGQSKMPVHFGEFGAGKAPIDFSMKANNSPETKQKSIVDWYRKELEHWKAITPFCGVESRILSHYLSTHDETPLEKKFGDRYGRYIAGWDHEKAEPIIWYCFGYVPQELLKHNIADVPMEYAAGDWWVGLDKLVYGDEMIIAGLPDNDGMQFDDSDGDLPF